MKPIKLSEQKPPDIFKYYLTWNAVNQEYLGELLWKYDYGYFVKTNLRCCFHSVSTVEERIPNVTHWMEVEDMPTPQADFNIKKSAEVVQFRLLKSEAQRMVDLLESAAGGIRLSEKEEDLADKIIEMLYNILED